MQLQKAVKLIDSGAVRATRFLWRYPVARVILVFYMVTKVSHSFLHKKSKHDFCLFTNICAGICPPVLDVLAASPPGLCALCVWFSVCIRYVVLVPQASCTSEW